MARQPPPLASATPRRCRSATWRRLRYIEPWPSSSWASSSCAASDCWASSTRSRCRRPCRVDSRQAICFRHTDAHSKIRSFVTRDRIKRSIGLLCSICRSPYGFSHTDARSKARSFVARDRIKCTELYRPLLCRDAVSDSCAPFADDHA